MPCCKRNGGACAARTDPCEPMSMWSTDPRTRSGQVACALTFQGILQSPGRSLNAVCSVKMGRGTGLSVQQRRRTTAEIGDTQRTPGPGNEHEENTCEHVRTIPTVSRMRYHEFHLNVPSQDTSGLGYFISVSLLKKASCKSISIPFFVSGWRVRLFP